MTLLKITLQDFVMLQRAGFTEEYRELLNQQDCMVTAC